MRVRAIVVGAIALALALLAFPGVNAQETVHHAGLVIRYDDGATTYAVVPFEEDDISGMELLRRSGVSLVSIEFGGLGEGVCSIGETGCSVADCRSRMCQSASRDSPYWRYFRQVAPGDWTALPLGASNTRVEDGQIDGWSWTPDLPDLPALTLDDLASQAGVTDLNRAGSSAVSRTFNADGELVEETNETRDDLAVYAGAVVLLVVMGGFVVFVFHRSRAAVPDDQ